MIALLTYLLRPSGSQNVLIRHVCLATHMQNLGNIVMVTTITLSPTTLSNNSTVCTVHQHSLLYQAEAFWASGWSRSPLRKWLKQKPSEQVTEAEVLWESSGGRSPLSKWLNQKFSEQVASLLSKWLKQKPPEQLTEAAAFRASDSSRRSYSELLYPKRSAN
jgi:hypothetical protein